MAWMNFLKPKNQLEEGGRTGASVHSDAGEPERTCPNCHKEIPMSRLWANGLVCACGHHFRMKARQRIAQLCDKGSFRELYAAMKADNPLDFPGYHEKAETARAASGETEAVVCGDFTRLTEQVTVTADDYVVVMTRGHQADYEVLTQVLRSGAKYLGCIGSRRKLALCRDRLLEDGFTETEYSRLHAPIGLAIGAQTPEEIAVSVAAEMIAVRAGVRP